MMLYKHLGHNPRISAWLLTLLPLATALLLSIINTNYISELFMQQPPYLIHPYLPWGWVLIGSVAVLSLLGRYLLWLVNNNLYEQKLLYIVTTISVVGLFVIPGILIVVLGPAMIKLLNSGL